jgi:putative flippase GtrA
MAAPIDGDFSKINKGMEQTLNRSRPDHNRALLKLAALMPGPVHAVLTIAHQLSRYSAVSALALALDLTIYLVLTAATMRPSSAGVIGYGAGIVLHYLLSVRFVFDASATDKVHAHLFGEFALSGLSGMVTTAIVIAAATDLANLSVFSAKALAAGASFLVVFALRRSVVFAARRKSAS